MTDKFATDDLYLCLDQGGHASRALVVDKRGQIHAQAFTGIETQREGARVEHDPEQLVATLMQSVAEALASLGADAERVVAAGLATQRSSIACWVRATGAPLSPVLSWQDTRAAEWLDAFADHWTTVHDITGLVLSPHYGASKLRWCLDNLATVREHADSGQLCMGPLAAFLAQRLTRSTRAVTDPANTSRTLLWDRRTRDWSPELLDLFGIPRDLLPDSVPSRFAWGNLVVEGRSIPLTVVTGDQSAALFAFGEPPPEATFVNMGTGAFLQRRLTDGDTDPGRMLASVVYQDEKYFAGVIEGTVNGAGSAIAAVAEDRAIAKDRVHANSATWLQDAQDPPLFLNSIAGLGSPWWRTDVAAEFVLPDAKNSTFSDADAIVAVMESVVFMLVVNLQTANALLGAGERIVVTGGLASVDPLVQRLADLSGCTIWRADVREATGTGLAFLLAGLPPDWPPVDSEKTFVPRPASERASLERRYARWQALMPDPNPSPNK